VTDTNQESRNLESRIQCYDEYKSRMIYNELE